MNREQLSVNSYPSSVISCRSSVISDRLSIVLRSPFSVLRSLITVLGSRFSVFRQMLRGRLWLVVLLACLPSFVLGQSYLIQDIEISGTSDLEAAQILHQLESQVGDPLDRRNIRIDLQTIYEMGLFVDARAEVEPIEDGYRLRFVVQERPRLSEVNVTGIVQVSKDQTLEKLTVKALDFYDPLKVEQNIEIIRNEYRKEGFSRVVIRSRIEKQTPEQYRLFIEVTERPSVFLTDIRVSGTEFLSELEIKRLILSAEIDCFTWMNNSGIFQEEMVNQDLALITQRYLKNGYIKVFLDKPKVTFIHNPEYARVDLRLHITEGDQYFTGKIDISGDILGDKQELLEKLQLEEGEVYNPFLQNQDRSLLNEAYQEQGYAFARVIPRQTIHEDNKTVDVTYQLIKGEKAYIGRVEIAGNAETKDHVIRREFDVLEGELFNGKKLRLSQENIQRLGFFEQGLTLNRSRRADADNILDILARLKETQTGTFQAQMGFSDLSGFSGGLSLSKGNILGTGRTLRLSAQFAEKSTTNQFSITLIDPRLFESQVSSTISFSRSSSTDSTELKRGSITENQYSLGFSVPVYYRNLRASVSVSALNRLYESDNATDVFKRSVTTGISWNSVNHPVFPSEGIKSSLSVTQTGRPFGGTVHFREYRYNYQQFWSLNPTRTLILMAKAQLGILAQQGSEAIPSEERYRIGGINTVRGHNYFRIAGPYGGAVYAHNLETIINADNSTTTRDKRTVNLSSDQKAQLVGGGTAERIFNLELIFPLSQDERSFVRGVVFLDAGNVNAESVQYSLLGEKEPAFLDLRRSAGFGVRVITPVGVLRFEYGSKLDPRSYESPDRFEFTISGLF